MRSKLLLARGCSFARNQQSLLSSKRLQSTKSTIDYNSEDYQLLQKSEIPTYHFQKSLRRLPIPKLEDSCNRYLNAVKAVTSDQEFRASEKVVNEFKQGVGPELQKGLLAYDKRNKHTSYISEPWFDLYLSSRLPCPVNFNPFMMFAPDPVSSFNNQLVRATNFVLAIGRFKKALDAECLAPEVFHLNPKKSDTALFRKVCKMLPGNLSWFGAVAFKAFPLDMSQYTSLFGGNRIPHAGKDKLHLNRAARHFLVMRNGNFYVVELFDSKGNLHRPEVVHHCLAKILEGSEKPAKHSECVGSLTTMDRNSWASMRDELLSVGPKNFDALKQVDDALFLLCLDDLKSEDPQRLIGSLLCGDEGSNRWFDKCFQLIVDGNGQATINFEHSWGDGVAVLRLMEETLKDSTQNRFVTPDTRVDNSVRAGDYLQKIEWDLNDSIRSKIEHSQKSHLARCKDLQYGTMEYKQLNRDIIKSHKLSPDAMLQLAIQLAFHRTYKEFVPTYESCSTAAFLKGRTECMRSATSATRETVLAVEKDGSNKSNAAIYELFQKCSSVHSQLAKESAMGQGFDRHFLGLKITANRMKLPEQPAFFSDKTFQRMSEFVLSTSTLSTDTIVFGGFGPVTEDGFGIGYNVVGSKLGAVVTSNKSKRDAEKFCESLEVSLDTIKNVLDKK